MRWIILALIVLASVLMPSAALAAIPPEALAHFKWYEQQYQPDVIRKMGRTIQKHRATLATAKQGNVLKAKKPGSSRPGAGSRKPRVLTYPTPEAKAKAVAKAEDDLEKAIAARDLVKTTFDPHFTEWLTKETVDTKTVNKKKVPSTRPKKVPPPKVAKEKDKAEAPARLPPDSIGYVGVVTIQRVVSPRSAVARVAGQSMLLKDIDTKKLAQGRPWTCPLLFKVVGRETVDMKVAPPRSAAAKSADAKASDEVTMPALVPVDAAAYHTMWDEYLASKPKTKTAK